MKKRFRSFDGLTKLIGASSLGLGSILCLPIISTRTLASLLLWIALITGGFALFVSLKGRCSWYAGTFIFIAALSLLFLRFTYLQTYAALLGIIISVTSFWLPTKKICTANPILK